MFSSSLRALLLIALLAGWASLAVAGFGLPESEGLLHVRGYDTVGLGAIRGVFSHSYYYQEVGVDSRYHSFGGRIGLAFGLGQLGQLSWDSRLLGLMRRSSENDPVLYSAIGASYWDSGLGDSDLGIRLVLPLPGSRVHLSGEGIVKLPTGNEKNLFGAGVREYELMGMLSLDLPAGRFVPLRLHLNYGLRLNRGRDGHGLPPELYPDDWSTFYPTYYPALDSAALLDELRQALYGVGLEFLGDEHSIYAELSLADLYWLRDEMSLREQPWQLAFGFRARGPWRLSFFMSFDLNLSKDDFATDFEPHFPRMTTSFGLTRQWQVLAGDPDGDGLRGADDLCPDRPEDFDGFEDHDGCPDPDNDQDGVPDSIDLAPNLKEDFDGFEDYDGRPDLDNDNDGIPDRQDLCPDRAEDFDGVDDEDGCPDREGLPGAQSEPSVPAVPSAQPSEQGSGAEDETPVETDLDSDTPMENNLDNEISAEPDSG